MNNFLGSKFIPLIPFMLLVISCGQSTNSNSGDDRFGLTINATDADALKIISDNCLACHNSWSCYATSAAYISAGLVVAGNPNSSSLITRIWNYNGPQSNMPKNAGPLSAGDYTILRNWVTNATALNPVDTNLKDEESLMKRLEEECDECRPYLKNERD